MNPTYVVGVLGVLLLSAPAFLVTSWTSSAETRLKEAEAAADAEPQQVAVAAAANEDSKAAGEVVSRSKRATSRPWTMATSTRSSSP